MLNHTAVHAAHQRMRWMRPDAGRYFRPDAAKSVKQHTDGADASSALADHRIALDGLRCNLNQIKSDLAWRRLLRAVAQKYNADQPRVLAGETGGGQWTSGGSGSGRPRIRIFRSNPEDEGAGDGGMLDEIVVDGSEVDSSFDGEAGNDDAFGSGYNSSWDDWLGRPGNATRDDERPTGINDSRVLSDADPETVRPGERYAANGHHLMPQALFNKWDLSPETRRVFNRETTGQLPGRTTIRISPDGVPISHGWNKAHREYNKAVEELSDSFLSRNNINPSDHDPVTS